MRFLYSFGQLVVGLGTATATNDCKCFPGDGCWPSTAQWTQLNNTVGGRLVSTVPLGKPCHGDDFNKTQCDLLKEQWLLPPIHYESSSSMMAPLFANASCDPWQPVERPCMLGNYVDYAVNVTCAGDVQAALAFARTHNVRFVIRNTGHDYLGRSTGAGALAVWTHHLKSTEMVDWADEFYTGPALRMGAGVQGFEALAAAHAAGYTVITGECPTVGVAGGYVQGGGHSALSSSFGLAADNVLAFEVVLPTGAHVVATRHQNADVYWALAGGGTGTYGVVLAVVTRALPDAVISGAKLAITTPADRPELVYVVVDAFHAALPGIVEHDTMVIYYFGTGFLSIPALTAYNKTRVEVESMLQPLLAAFVALNLTVVPTYTEFDSYYDHYGHYWGPLPAGNIEVGASLYGGRLISAAQVASFSPTSRALIDLGVTLIGVGLNVSRFADGSTNAVLPAWRDALVSASLTYSYNFTAPFSDMRALQDHITAVVQPVIEAATPGSGAYLNEADFQQLDFQDVFYGRNYDRLLAIKNALDPDGLLYGHTAVGSEMWALAEDGHMCKTV
ncbi:FAD-binding domain containing protein [Grosmannia clavigera kw1407]|uniref:FAD-binding domain containing protein n=1 Tax=Grosmannia clavigera (strain kw1407 / UAMH 11150) TaxID=655863 RepID=F0XNP7_GROCL|nr:FAD-binding domain containing protein [Grosmannia clavigera kw1407]EFX00315.1 FAD-binding domain containing protein [Grosmannia clavigera kw1407]